MRCILSIMVLALGISGGLVAGCGKSRQASVDAILDKSTAELTEAGTYKTPKGRPVRVFKATVNYVNQRENLLLVVGEAGAVSMSDAVTVKIGSKTGKAAMFIAPMENAIVAMSGEDPAKTVSIVLDAAGNRPESKESGPSSGTAFPMESFKAKIHGETLNLPELDTL